MRCPVSHGGCKDKLNRRSEDPNTTLHFPGSQGPRLLKTPGIRVQGSRPEILVHSEHFGGIGYSDHARLLQIICQADRYIFAKTLKPGRLWTPNLSIFRRIYIFSPPLGIALVDSLLTKSRHNPINETKHTVCIVYGIHLRCFRLADPKIQ